MIAALCGEVDPDIINERGPNSSKAFNSYFTLTASSFALYQLLLKLTNDWG